ncbi:MAG: hypothetical protein BECKG1743D_GA0114223_101881 [Candidatus Kentron sp. G]|nr:MAG: hypothetical protein BECKG1743D_GA0114223_101881 [Candidatus Kentron sp. G]
MGKKAKWHFEPISNAAGGCKTGFCIWLDQEIGGESPRNSKKRMSTKNAERHGENTEFYSFFSLRPCASAVEKRVVLQICCQPIGIGSGIADL